jgi:tetratricopeptide (TPR) repeat protein
MVTPLSPSELVQSGDRSRRRGDMAQALSLYRQALEQDPSDVALEQRIQELEGSLQPLELMNPKARAGQDASGKGASLEEEAERLVAAGDLTAGLGLYRRALSARPESALLQERVAELFAQVRAAPAPGIPHPGTGALDPEQKLKVLLDRITSRKRA